MLIGSFMTFLLTMLIASQAHAWLSVDDPGKSYSFKFRMENETYEYQQKASSYEDAFAKAAEACFKHFKQGRRLSEDRGIAIIDVCANPRTI